MGSVLAICPGVSTSPHPLFRTPAESAGNEGDDWLDAFDSETGPPATKPQSAISQTTALVQEVDNNLWANEFASEKPAAEINLAVGETPMRDETVRAAQWLREWEAGKALIESKRAALRRALEPQEYDHAKIETFEVHALDVALPVPEAFALPVEEEFAAEPAIAMNETAVEEAPAMIASEPPVQEHHAPPVAVVPVKEKKVIVREKKQRGPKPVTVVQPPQGYRLPQAIAFVQAQGPEQVTQPALPPLEQVTVIVERPVVAEKEAAQAVSGDYACPKCLFVSLKRSALRCATCHADIPENYWPPIIERERLEEEARALIAAQEQEQRAQLSKRVAEDWKRGAGERQRRARLAEQKAERRRQIERWEAQVAAAQAHGQKEWRRFFCSVYFAYVLPGLVVASVAALNGSIERGVAFWVNLLMPVVNWVGSIYLLVTPFAVQLPRLMSEEFDVTRGIELSWIYPIAALVVWTLVGVLVGIGYPRLGQTDVRLGAVPKAPVRPGGAALALAIGALVLGVSLTVEPGPTFSLLAQMGDVISAFTH